jgi:hypothetical protein
MCVLMMRYFLELLTKMRKQPSHSLLQIVNHQRNTEKCSTIHLLSFVSLFVSLFHCSIAGVNQSTNALQKARADNLLFPKGLPVGK